MDPWLGARAGVSAALLSGPVTRAGAAGQRVAGRTPCRVTLSGARGGWGWEKATVTTATASRATSPPVGLWSGMFISRADPEPGRSAS